MPPLVVITGETASGKSALALELARRFNGEIICADSWTVYKYFDIGTAKPSQQERLEVPHHLLDVTTADKGFSAPQFQRLALVAIEDISRRHKLPIMVGGTGLYIDSVLYDYSFLPASSSQLRTELNSLSLEDLLQRARNLALPLDNIDTRNKRRVIRLIENNGQLPTRSNLRQNTLLIGVATDRNQLLNRAEARVDKMIASGLEREVESLGDRYGWDCEPMKGIGYREWYDFFKGAQALDETRAKILKSTMELAKKQRTWFWRNKSIHWVNKQIQAVELTTTFLNK